MLNQVIYVRLLILFCAFIWWAYRPNLVGGGHSIGLPNRFALCYTVHIYNFVRDFVRAFFNDFPGGGGALFEKGLFHEIIRVGKLDE
jgi:hypothetical protein